MYRILFVLSAAVLLSAVVASPASAQADEAWPLHDAIEGHNMDRGPGGYLSVTKIVLLWMLFLVWVVTTGWVNRDCQTVRMPYSTWIPIVFFPFLAGFFLFALQIPIFFVGYLLLVICVVAPLGVYIWQRNAKTEAHARVLTRSHIRHVLSDRAKAVGVAISAEKKANYEKGPPVTLTAMGGETDRDNNANLLTARQSPGFVFAKELISDAVARRADKVMLDYAREGVAVRYQIDGFWHDVDPREREDGDLMLAVLKKISALNPEERRDRQEGRFGAQYEGASYAATLISQGTKTGERAIVQLADDKVKITVLAETGIREKVQEQLKEILARRQGFVLISAMPSGGLTTATYAVLRATDRYIRDFAAVEDEAHPEEEVENVEVTTYNGPAGETPATVLPKLIRKEPNVIVVRDLPNAETVRILCNEAVDGRLILSTIRAKEAVEALVRVLLLKVPANDFAAAITAVLNVRLIRKLCDTCKEAYTPPPDLLKKLGIPQGRVKAFHRPPQPKEDEKQEVCGDCNGIGYKGRTGIFELLTIDDALRTALVKQPKLDVLRKQARKAGSRSLQDEGLLLVARGVTSLPELMRVLKQ